MTEAENESGASCYRLTKRNLVCWISCTAFLLVMIVLGTGIMAEWNAWAQYKKLSSDEFVITITCESGERIDVPPGHHVKEFRTIRRVDVISNDKTKHETYFNPVKLTARAK